MNTDFDWSLEQPVVPEQRAITVYETNNGNIAIRQSDWPEDDAVILVHPNNAEALAEAILREAGIMVGTVPTSDGEPARLPAPLPGALRQRRRRQRKRDGERDSERDMHRDASVTGRDIDRDGVTATPLFPDVAAE